MPTSKLRRTGETPLARDFFAGLYAKVVAAGFDAPEATYDDVDTAFVVGALTFLGRLEEAQTCFDAWRLRTGATDGRTLAAARFFLGVAQARAGNFDRARELLVHRVRERVRTGDAWSAAFAFQGLAVHRYFTGRYRAAARHALRAIRAAQVDNFPYAKMLATDLRGHALVQIGQLRAGLGLLEQARSHAEGLGFGMNAYAIECSMARYAAKFMVTPQVVQQLEKLLTRQSHDSYSQHALLTELATVLSLRGRRADALRALERAELHAMKIDARRAKVTSLLARLHVTRWSEGIAACAPLVDETAALVEEADVAFRAELLGVELLVARAAGDEARRAKAETALHALARSHHLHWARAALEQAGVVPRTVRAFAEDQLSPLLHAVAERDVQVIDRLLGHQLLGAVPEVLGLTPAKRIIILSAEDTVLLEDRGDVLLRPHPPRWCAALLRLLASGDVPKEEIVAKLWGLRVYRPDRHDPLIRTTIHRLRTFLEPHGPWVRVTPSGYGTSVPVLFVGVEEPERHELEVLLTEGEEAPAEIAVATRSLRPPNATEREAATAELVVQKLGALQQASIRDLSRAVGVSQSTTLRALRDLVAAKRVVRTGHARATRYSLRDA